jgi:hypothetical protein
MRAATTMARTEPTGGPEQGESELGVAEAEVLFELGYVGRPGREQEAVHEEHGDDGHARPAVH